MSILNDLGVHARDEKFRRVTVLMKATIGQKIKIKDLELCSVVVGIYMGRYHTTYEVAYFHNGDRKQAYLYDHEFEVEE